MHCPSNWAAISDVSNFTARQCLQWQDRWRRRRQSHVLAFLYCHCPWYSSCAWEALNDSKLDPYDDLLSRKRCAWIEHEAGDWLDDVHIQGHAIAAIFYESLNLRFDNARIVKLSITLLRFLSRVFPLQLNMYWYLQIFTLLNTHVVL